MERMSRPEEQLFDDGCADHHHHHQQDDLSVAAGPVGEGAGLLADVAEVPRQQHLERPIEAGTRTAWVTMPMGTPRTSKVRKRRP